MTRRPTQAVERSTAVSGVFPTIPDDATWRRWGIEPTWSRTVDAASHAGGTRRWHVLDTGVPAEVADDGTYTTILCVHGNPTWSYVWSSFLHQFGDRHRVVAIDQLGMGFSERTPPRRYVDRVRDLDDIIVALGLSGHGPLVVAAHDWGGAIAMGWVVQDPRQVAGLILCNTGIAVPKGRSAPRLIRLAASAPLLDVICRGTPIFVEGTARLGRRRIGKLDREALRAPYRSAPSRAAIADFVADIPLHDDHPSERAIADVADRLSTVQAPVLLAWGAKDPVFDDSFANDLAARFPNTTRHRFAKASHLVMLEADVAEVADLWIDDLLDGTLARPTGGDDVVADDGGEERHASLWSAIARRRGDTDDAFVDLATGEALNWVELDRRVNAVAAELRARGLRPGDRVAMLTPPGIDLVAAVYGVWRAGGVTVVADRGLGLRALGRAVRSTSPSWVIGPRAALVAAASMRWAPRATALDVADLVDADAGELPPEPTGDDLAAILFTSGATGPAKGVRYRHRQLAAQRDALARTYAIGDADRLVAAFAPFALYGPALGIPTALPDCDVTKPAELTAAKLDAACQRIGATLAFASPSALANVVDTAESTVFTGLADLRLVLSAGAPVPSETLRNVSALTPAAELHTPYGMTEVLPVADIALDEIEESQRDEPAGGVCVGVPVEGVEVRVVPLWFDSDALPESLGPGETGEILVRAPWVSDGYDGLWGTQRVARPGADADWHRSGDVGHLDDKGRLWVEGRAVHVIRTADGPVSSVPVERVVERALGTVPVAAVGVGPTDAQQIVVVIEESDGEVGPAPQHVVERVRAALDVPVAAVLIAEELPVDVRHNAKIDRVAVASWAASLLAGRRAGRLR